RQVKHRQNCSLIVHIFFYVCGLDFAKIMIKKGLSRIVFFFLYLVSLLPFWFLYLISDILFILIFYIAGYRRKVVQENLRNSFPDKDQKELADIEKKFFKYLADLIVETV